MLDKKILIVDDSPVMRKILRDTLEGAGYMNLIEATNGQEAMDIFATEKPDLMFLDIIMPDVSGMDVLREIGKGAKVVVVSAVGQNAMIDTAKKLGAMDYIIKPFDQDQVLAKTARYLR
jgi:two-component system chemotaxis response regulator CheY